MRKLLWLFIPLLHSCMPASSLQMENPGVTNSYAINILYYKFGGKFQEMMNEIDDIASPELVEIQEDLNWPFLTYVRLEFNNMGPQEFRKIQDALRKNSNIIQLDVNEY